MMQENMDSKLHNPRIIRITSEDDVAPPPVETDTVQIITEVIEEIASEHSEDRETKTDENNHDPGSS